MLTRSPPASPSHLCALRLGCLPLLLSFWASVQIMIHWFLVEEIKWKWIKTKKIEASQRNWIVITSGWVAWPSHGQTSVMVRGAPDLQWASQPEEAPSGLGALKTDHGSISMLSSLSYVANSDNLNHCLQFCLINKNQGSWRDQNLVCMALAEKHCIRRAKKSLQKLQQILFSNDFLVNSSNCLHCGCRKDSKK